MALRRAITMSIDTLRDNGHVLAESTPVTDQQLVVSTAPWPGDVRLVVHAQPDAEPGMIDVRLGLGRGTRGKGQRPGDDHDLYVATLHNMAEHITAYANAYDAA